MCIKKQKTNFNLKYLKIVIRNKNEKILPGIKKNINDFLSSKFPSEIGSS